MQHLSLLVEVAGLEEKRVEVKRHIGEVFQNSRTSLNEALSSKESQGLHVFSYLIPVFFVCVGAYLIQRLVSFVAAAPLVSSVAVSLGVLLW